MPTLGSNLKTKGKRIMMARISKALGYKRNQLGMHKLEARVYAKAGVPADNTEADSPAGAPAFIWDYTNDDVYFCDTYTNDTSFNVTKMSA